VLFNLWFNYKIIVDSNSKHEEKVNYIVLLLYLIKIN